ncbi:MAG: CapA family protein [Solirubrobacterales bacterium]
MPDARTRSRAREARRAGARPRQSPAVYRRRRLGAVLVLAALILLGVLVVELSDSGAPQLTPAQEKLVARTENPVHLTLSVSGDILIHSYLWERALANGGGGSYDFAPFFEQIKPFTAATDLPICHVETPMTSSPPTSYPIFNTPTDLAKGIAESGWKACDTASNHSLDQGQSGVDQTGEALDRAGIAHTGSFPSARAQHKPLILEAKGVKVGYLAYTDFTNGIPLPHPWSVNYLPYDDPVGPKAERILAAAKRDRNAGAEAVVLQMQWGDENSTDPNDSQLELARRLTASPLITAIVGQGPHVVQPIEKINGKFVVFSEGNLVSNQSALAGLPAETQYGLIALLHVVADGRGVRVQRVTYVPTWVRLSDYVVLPVGIGLRRDPGDAAALRDAYDTVVGIAGRAPGIQPVPRRLPPG